MISERGKVVWRQGLEAAVTSKFIPERPVHRWFWFPHSYSPELVEALLDTWNLPGSSVILDPFVGAGTTLRVAMERGYSAVGTDLSPLAVVVSNVKVRAYQRGELEWALETLRRSLEARSLRELVCCTNLPPTWRGSPRMRRAFTLSELTMLAALRERILQLPPGVQDFFMVAALGILPEFSRAVADGGWFRWTERLEQPEKIVPYFLARAESMLEDLLPVSEQPEGTWEALLLDARNLSALSPRAFDALITSPPYPNRHDYTRVFQIELLFLGCSEEEIAQLRYRSLRSHVEARPPGADPQPVLARYRAPSLLKRCLGDLPAGCDRRLKRMLEGYFEDLFLVLRCARSVLRPEAKVAFVVGNVRYGGVLFPVDRILVAVGYQADFRHVATWALRARGNSAQQMGRYGKVPSLESVVIMEAV